MDWRQTTVAPDRSHHLLNGVPLYPQRFREVLKFHEPGLAPAVLDDGATHIDVGGLPAYEARFERTFGFYDGLAAVDADGGWFHVRPDGTPLYGERYSWCGNFQQSRCAVRTSGGLYLHIDDGGAPLYDERWRYVGDFRDGAAVVQRNDGLHSHIDTFGAVIHGRWYDDLDVFHKGFARARDQAGWMHLDAMGEPVYARRFAAVEPFYNGQARVEDFDGALLVIDEQGSTRMTLRPARRSEFTALSSDLVGFWRTEAIAAAVRLGLFETLPGTTAELADRLSAQPGRLATLMRAMCDLQLVRADGDRWTITRRGELLRVADPMTLADAALEYAGPLGDLWRDLDAALTDPLWTGPDVFGQVASTPERVASHHRMLRSYARHDYPGVAAVLQLGGDEHVVDAGGGVGVLAAVLLEAHPGLTVTVLDRPEVIAQLPVRPRLTGVDGDLFAPWGLDVDVVVLARVLHDWPDEEAVRILRNAGQVLRPQGRVFLIEMLIEGDGAFGGLCDLHLLMATGGRDRTRDEYKALLEEAGFELVRVEGLDTTPTVLEAVLQ